MKPSNLRLRWLAALALPLVAVACSDTTPTSPEADFQDVPQFSAHGGGGQLFAADGAGGLPATLYTLDPTTGAATPVGPIGFSGVRALAFAPDGTLYGLAGNRGPTGQLITIDPLTGAGTAVGPTDALAARFDLSFRNSDGALFASGRNSSFQVVLSSVDPGTGAATPVGLTGTFEPGNGIAFSSTDVLYHVDFSQLYTLDPATAAATPVASLTFSGFPGGGLVMNALASNPATDVLYGSVNGGNPASNGPNYLATVNTTTGEVSNVGLSVLGLAALAWGGVGDVTPPTVTADLLPADEGGANKNKGLFVVSFTCTDDVDPNPVVTALLNDLVVENGQVLDLRLKDKDKTKDKDKEDKATGITASSFELVVTCTDESGNEGSATATPVFGG